MALAMARRRAPLRFDSSRLARGPREEIGIGAYARRQLRRRILIGVFGALLIAGAFLVYYELRPPRVAYDVDHYPVRVRCLSCGYTGTLQVRPTQTFPMKCPQCGETACQELWTCRDCGAQFVPDQAGTTVRCPECGSVRVGSAAVP
jgi:ribosomal protein S27E